MTRENIARLAAFQRVCKAAEDLAELGQKEATEHLLALDSLRGEFMAIDDLLRPHFFAECNTLETIRSALKSWEEDKQALAEARATVARLEDADRLGREAHMAVVSENVRLREEATKLRAILTSEGCAVP